MNDFNEEKIAFLEDNCKLCKEINLLPMNRLKISEEHTIIRQAMIRFAQEVLGRASKTAKDYTESMERFLPRFMENYMNINVQSIYDVHDLEFLQNIHDQIKNKQEWKEYNAKKHGCTFTSGLKCYIEFHQSDYYPFKGHENVEQVPVSMDNIPVHVEGKVYESHSVGFERNLKAREECLKHYGYKCSVCGFDFEKEYGEIGRGFIEVHHIVPLSSIRDEYVVDPIRDLRPLCSNCHSMVHRREPVVSLEELKEMRNKYF